MKKKTSIGMGNSNIYGHSSKRLTSFASKTMPLRKLFPSLITMMALCMGVTALRYALEGRFQLAASFVLFSAVLDVLDGRVARMLKATSSFGAQLDSLADMVSFGVVPVLVLYLWMGNGMDATQLGAGSKNALWLVSLLYTSCTAMRLARFNIQTDMGVVSRDTGGRIKDVDALASSAEMRREQIYLGLIAGGYFFNGMPSTVSALVVLMPLIVSFELLPGMMVPAWFLISYIGLIAMMMICKIPTMSSKKIRIKRHWVPLALSLVVCSLVWIILDPWIVLPILTAAYLGSVPYAFYQCRRAIRSRYDEEVRQRGGGVASQ